MKHRSFLALWQEREKENNKSPFLKVSQSVHPPIVSYTYTSFYKRAMRVASALRKGLRVERGDRIVALLEEPNDIALMVHGCCLAQICCVLAPPDMSVKSISQLIEATGAQHVVFPPSLAAKIASLLHQNAQVKEWIVTGKGTRISGIQNLRHLDDLLLSAAGDELELSDVSEEGVEVLLLPSETLPGTMLSYTDTTLLAGGMALKELYPEKDSEKENALTWNMYPLLSFHGILHSLLSPLFTEIPSLALPLTDTRDFWRHLSTNDVAFALLTQKDLQKIYSQGKPRDLRISDELTLGLSTRTYFSHDTRKQFLERFAVKLCHFFSHEFAAGVVSVAAENDAIPLDDILSAGRICSDLTLHSDPSRGLTVKSSRVFTNSYGSVSVPRTNPDEIPLGYLGQVENGELRLDGKISDIVHAGGKQINLARIEQVAMALRGVNYACAYHIEGGVALYVVSHRLSNLTELDLDLHLSELLERYEVPSIYEFADAEKAQPYPTRAQLLQRG